MSIKSRANPIRQNIMRRLTGNIGRNSIDMQVFPADVSNVKRILITRPNSRLGNQILVTPLIQEIERIFPNCTIDLFVRSGTTAIILQNYTSIGRIIKLPLRPFKELPKYMLVWLQVRKYKYDLVINVTNTSSSGRLSTKFARSEIKFFCDTIKELAEKYNDYFHIAKFPVYNLRYYLSQAGVKFDDADIPILNLKLSESELRDGKEKLYDITQNQKKTICIYTFATGNKCYSKDWWERTYEAIKQKYGESYNIVEILPVQNVSQIDFKALSFYSKSIREIASVMANTELFVGADCGIMHLASASGIPVLGLFSVTDPKGYGPYGNASGAIDTNTNTTEDILNAIDDILFKIR